MSSALLGGISNVSMLLEKGSVTSQEVTHFFLDRIHDQDKDLNSFITVTKDLALEMSRQSDARREAGQPLSPLDGIPLALKDNIDVATIPTTAGIEVRRHRIAEHDAFVVKRLREAGAVLIGKTNMDEAALGGTTDNKVYGRCHNANRRDWTPGGSSGGSGAAVVAGLCAAALGTDTLGSVRTPASYNGCVGFKPTYGLVSQRGVVPLSPRFDHVGPITKTVTDAAMLLSVMVGYDDRDPYAQKSPNGFELSLPESKDLSGVTLGRLVTDPIAEISEEILHYRDEALDVLAKRGARIVDIYLGGFNPILLREAALKILESDGAQIHDLDLEEHPELFTDSLRVRLLAGRTYSEDELSEAQNIIDKVEKTMSAVFEGIEALILPTSPQTAYPFSEGRPEAQTYFTSIANFTGMPAVALPNALCQNGMPSSFTIMTPQFQDQLALDLAYTYEQNRAGA